MYSSLGRWETTEKVFDRMEWRDVVSWTTMISGYENNVLPDKAVDTYRRMELQGFMPDEITLAIVLSACTCFGYAQRGQGKLVVEFFDRMIESNVNPDEITFILLLCACSKSRKHYACVVDLLGRAGQLEDTYEFIQEMPIKPDPAIWGALLNACRIH
ncbi:hypothetical protein CRYUN_Cryun31cG0095200 [Craigia yunnanensis]